MPVQVRCECGKRYRVVDEARGRRIRCKECGAELLIPRTTPAPADDEVDLSEIDPDDSAGDDETALPPPIHSPAKRGRGRAAVRSSRFSTGDIIVRSTGLLIFLTTLGNCAYQLLTSQAPPDKGPSMDTLTSAILPILIAGLLGLYVAYVGEEPDRGSRIANRMRGFILCGAGIGMILLGGVLTFGVTTVLKQLAGIGVLFTGLIIGGAAVFVYGGLSALTGRKFKLPRS